MSSLPESSGSVLAGTDSTLRATHPREPGLARRGAGWERYRVPAAGAVVLELRPDDRLSVLDPEGRQPCELVVFAADGRSAPDLLGGHTVARGGPSGLIAMLSGEAETARMLAAALRRRGLDLASAEALLLFGPESPAGESVQFVAQGPAVLVAGAPARASDAWSLDPPTEIRMELRRARPLSLSEIPLPEPLADPRLDLRIDRATAVSYEVKAGEFIQIIDVAGRQCSDFLAFDRARLDQGLERGLEATTTRTLMGSAYPLPGLYSKFFDQDMNPLVEVIRDTVGRHDTFALACNAKYYADAGYPGHINCSDNFNAALAAYPIAPRPGWPAINFFYNTNFDAHHVLYLEEPWSRPGDYVLLQAQRDLVCASSACPDDIDPANAWEPTDIHVRVYGPKNVFSKAVAYRMTADAEAQLTKETGFHPRTSALTRDFTEYRGYWLANSYRDEGPLKEYWACRERVAVIDLSALRKFEVMGPDAEQLMQYALTRNVRRLAVGQVVYSAICHETGGMLDDGTLLRLGDDNFRWVCGDDYCGVWLRELAEKQGLRVWVRNATDQLHNISVQGPKSRETLKRILWTPPKQPSIEELGWFRFTIARLGGANGIPLVASRTGYTGELGYELWCHPKDAPALWDAVFESGAADEIAPLGLAALDMLRIEAGLIFAGYEFCDQTDPFEAGIGFTVPLKTKEEDFVGREALIERKAHPQRKLVGLELDGNEAAAHGDGVYIGRAQVGVVTSATRSPILKKSIALCRIDQRHAEEGKAVEVGKLDGQQKRLAARVVRFPFYDPDKTRVRA